MILKRLGNLLYVGFATWMNKEIEPPVQAPSDLSRAAPALSPGDVILVEGRSRIGKLIKNASQSSWTHCAIFVGRISDHAGSAHYALLKDAWQGSENEYLLLEAEIGTGAILTKIDKYRDYNVRICRPQALTKRDADSVVESALNHLDHEYDVRQLVDLARFMYPIRFVPRRWRSALFETRSRKSQKRTICSTLIADAFYSVDFPIRPIISKDEHGDLRMNKLNARLCTPKDFDASPYFDILKFPWIPIVDPGVYRNLPWVNEQDLKLQESPSPAASKPSYRVILDPLVARGLILVKSLRSLVRLPTAK
ncbi:MAG TPA: hypothetical protein DD827_02535 [Gammaproteobacteria bacterium]|jgi:hypothetical protein|nr:hypothetical protein [Gammaproteobacteria bacterium]